MFKKNVEVTVKVARVPGKSVEVVLNGDHTVSDALEAAGFSMKSTEEVRVNSVEAELTKDLKNGDRVTLIRNIEGGTK
jgi:sulfur carrier protein ThiS